MDAVIFETNRKKQKKLACRTVNALACVMLCATALSYLLWMAVDGIAPYAKIGFQWLIKTVFSCSTAQALSVTQSLADSFMVAEFLSMLVDLVGFFLPFYLFGTCILSRGFDETFPLTGGRRLRGIVPVFACSQLLALAITVFSEQIGVLLFPGLFYDYASQDMSLLGAPELLVYFLSLCVFTPLVEEYVFRGVIFGSLRRFGFGFAAVSSALFFGLAHGSASQCMYAVIFGLVLAAVFEKTGSVRGCIFLHMANNAVNFLFVCLLPKVLPTERIDQMNWVYNALLGILAIVGFFIVFQPARNRRQSVPAAAVHPVPQTLTGETAAAVAEPADGTDDDTAACAAYASAEAPAEVSAEASESELSIREKPFCAPFSAFWGVGTVLYAAYFIYEVVVWYGI